MHSSSCFAKRRGRFGPGVGLFNGPMRGQKHDAMGEVHPLCIIKVVWWQMGSTQILEALL